jgi:DNA-binding CsgD family transcriptional regulator
MNPTAVLSKRENEITELLAWGLTYKEVANRLFLSVRTVETTAKNSKKKAEVTTINGLSAWFFCTHFNISLELSPLKRSLVAMTFLLIWLPFEFSTHADALRSTRGRRVRTEEVRTRSGRRNELTIEF